MKSKYSFCILHIAFSLLITCYGVKAESNNTSVDIYKVNYDLINNFDILKKGTKLDVVLQSDLSTVTNTVLDPVDFIIFGDDNLVLMASGYVSLKKEPRRLKKSGLLKLTISKLYLSDGREINFGANSLLVEGIHSPHANTNSVRAAKYITLLSVGASPATLGASLGISFLVNGLLSTRQNGISDFLWGGLDGSGLAFLEHAFRKQPELYLNKGMQIPFVLNEEVKISKGLHKEAIEQVNMQNEEAINKIQTLLKWGDLTGALELSIQTGQEEVYKKLLKEIMSGLTQKSEQWYGTLSDVCLLGGKGANGYHTLRTLRKS